MLAIAHWTGSIDGAVVHVRQWPGATFAFLVAGVLIFLLWEGWRGKAVAIGLIVAGLVVAAVTRPPDILISETGKLMAVRGGDGRLYLSSGRKEKFVAENWMRLDGRAGEKPLTFRSANSPMLCDDDGCRGEIEWKKLAIVRTPKAMREDCAWADIFISEGPVAKAACETQGPVLGLYDYLEGGAMAVYLEDMRIVRTRKDGEVRPWTKMR